MDNVKFEDKSENNNTSLFENIEDETENKENKNKRNRKRKRKKDKAKSYSELIGEYVDNDSADINKNTDINNADFENENIGSLENELSNNRTTCPKVDTERKRIRVNENAKSNRYADTLKTSAVIIKSKESIQPNTQDVYNPDTKVDFQNLNNSETELFKQSYEKFVTEQTSSISDEVSTQSCIQNGYSLDTKHIQNGYNVDTQCIQNGYSSGTHTDFHNFETDGTTDFDDVKYVSLKENEISPKRSLRRKNNDSSSQTDINTAYSQFTLSYENDELADFEKSKESKFGSEKESKFSYGLDKEVSVPFDENIVEESVLNKCDNSSSKRNYIGSSMFESSANKGDIESKETSHRVVDRKKKAFSDRLLNKSSENDGSSYSDDNRFAALTEEKSLYSNFEKSAENNGSLFVDKVDNTNENLIDRLNEDNDFESGYITKHNELSEHHTKRKANENYKSSFSTENSDFEKSIASNSTVFVSGELNGKVDFDIKSDDVNSLTDNLLNSHTKNKQRLSKELNDKQGEFFENSYNDAEFKKLNFPTDYSESIDAKSNVFTDKLAVEENHILFTEYEKSGEQGKKFDSEIDENVYKTTDDENISDVLRTDNYNSQFQSENSIPNENSTAKSEKSADIKSLKKKKSTDYNNTFSNISVYKKGRPRLKDSAIVKNFRKANRIYAKAKKIAKVVDVDSKNTITEDAKNIAVGAALGAGEKALKDMAFNSVKVDKFSSDKKKNNLSSDKVSGKYSNNSALKEISKKFARQQQYKNVMEMQQLQQLYKQAAVKAAKTKAASAASKGLLAFFSVPVVPIITFILVVALVSMFIWGTVLIVLGIADGLVSTTYMTTNSEITSSTAYYTKLESELLARVNETIEELNDNNKIDKVETEFDPIEHNPEQLEAYLSAVYPGYDFNGGFVNWVLHKLVGYPYYGFGGIKNVENDIFDYQYSTEVTYRTEKKGFYVIKIATVHLYNKGFDNTIEYFLQNLPEEYYKEDEKELIYDHYKDLREYRGNHGFWIGTPVDYDWRNYVVGLYGYETTNGGITSVSSIGTVQSKSAVTETTDEDISHYDQKLLGNFTTTGYCPCVICCGKYSPEVTGKPSTTASGTFPVQGRTIAVDPKVIPLGAKVLINGHIYTAEDTGGAIKGNRIDVYYNNHQDALVHGKQTGVTVYLLTLKTGEEEPASTVSSSDNKLADIALEELEEGVSGTPNKYTEWYGEIRGTTSYNWCAAFVSYCVDKAGMSSIVPKTAAVSDLMDNAQKSGIWQSKDSYKPVAGDIMIQKENGTSHTGIVVESTDTYFIAVEGNSGSNSLSSSKVGKYKYFYDDENAVTGFIQTGSTAENFGGSMYYRFNNFAKGTDIKKHKGIDIAGTSSTNVLSVIDGNVKRKTSDSLVIENDMFEVTYESIKDISSEIGRGSEVTLGQVVAKMDDAESRDVPIVHISVIQKDGNEEMNPFIYCDIGTGSAPYVNLSSSLVNVGIGGGTVSALFGDIHAPYTDEFANRAVVTSSFFDTYHTSFHRAIDLDVTYGSNVGIAAAWDGKVVMVGSGNGNGLTGYGYVVVLEHNIDGVMVYTKYNHMKMNSSTLNVGDVVSAGQQIGIQGSTGFASGEHLDFQMGICTSGYNWSEFSNHLINPIAIYQGWSQSLQTISVWNSSGGCVRKGDDYNQTRKVNNMSGKHIF